MGVTIQQDKTTSDWKINLNFGFSPYYFGVSQNRSDLLTEVNRAQKEILEEIKKNLGVMYDPAIGKIVLDNWEEIIKNVSENKKEV